MKKHICTTLLASILFSTIVNAQWNINGTGNATLINASIKVGIGTSSPGSKLTVRTSSASQGLIITNCDVTGSQSHFGFTTSDQSNIGLASESYLNTYNDGKWNFNSANSSGGTTLPLSFNTDGVSRIYIKPNGHVGIGTANPQFKLDIAGQLAVGGIMHIESQTYPENNYVRSSFGSNVYWDAASNQWVVRAIGANDFSAMIHPNQDGLAFVTSPSQGNADKFLTNGQFFELERMRITANGNVGIGTSYPDAKLAVNGQIHATEVKVTTTVPGPDYVFEKDYNLPSLEELKAYIVRNKHLPEVPSAKEMETNGVKLGEMNMMLLKKIEEQTLYIIEMNRQLQELRTQMEELKK